MASTKLTERNAYENRAPLAHSLPYLEIVDDFVIKKNGNFVAGFEIEALDNMGMFADDYTRLSSKLEDVLNTIDENINLQFSYSFDYHPYAADFVYTNDPVLDFFKQQRHKYYGYYKYLTCRMNLFVDFDAGKSLRTPFNILMSGASIKTRLHEEHRALVEEKNNELKAIQPGFENFGIKLRRMRNSDLANKLFQAINLSTHEFNGVLRGKATNNELIAHDYQVEKGYLKIGNQYVACLSLSLLPEVTRAQSGFNGIPLPYLFPLLHNLPFPHQVVLSTQNLDMEKETARLSRKLNFTRFITSFSRQREGPQKRSKISRAE